MIKFQYYFLILFTCLSCVKVEVESPSPEITMFYGLDSWTSQPTFVYSDTTLNSLSTKLMKVQFAAAACIKNAEISVNGVSIGTRKFDNDCYYNYDQLFEIQPTSIPEDILIEFSCEDRNGKKAQKSITVLYR